MIPLKPIRLSSSPSKTVTREVIAVMDAARPVSVVLAVDLFSAILARQSPSDDLAAAVRQGYQNARDTLYLFGARHLVPQSDDLLAVFVAPTDTDTAAFRVRALRGALALVKGPDIGMTAALHSGHATLVHVTDPLHGDAGSVLTGETAPMATALQAFARKAGWRVACSATLLEGLDGQVVVGQQASFESGGTTLTAVEVVSLN